jgi:hypothetical protein
MQSVLRINNDAQDRRGAGQWHDIVRCEVEQPTVVTTCRRHIPLGLA